MAITFNHNDQVYVKDGKMGIGASDPLRNLHVVGNFAVNAGTGQYYGVYIPGVGEGADPQIQIGDWHNASATITWDSAARSLNLDTQYSSGAGTFKITGNDGASEFLRITSAGNVGIGTTSPTRRLHIRSSSEATGIFLERTSNYGFVQYNAQVGSVETYHLGFVNNNTLSSDILVANESGNVGIGTNSPAFTSGSGLEIQRAGTATLRLDSGNLATELRAYTDGTFLGQLSASYLDLGTNNTTRVRIDGSGNVGIGTTSPDALLDIGVNNIITLDDTGSSTGFIGLGSYNDGTKNRAQGASYYGFGLEIDRPSQNISFNSYDSNGVTTGGTNILVLTRDGKVGIGTDSPNATLEVKTGTSAGTVRLSSDANGAIFSANGDLQFYTNNTVYATKFYSANKASTLATILDNGNVGIGTASPVTKLYVDGGESTFNRGNSDGAIARFRGSNAEQAVIGTVTSWFDSNVGIGTTSPATKLDVVDAIPIITLRSNNDSYASLSYYSNSVQKGLITYNAANNALQFSHKETGTTSNDAHLVIKEGNVGIGTTNPIGNLNINGGTGDAVAQDSVLNLTRTSSTGNVYSAKLRLVEGASTTHGDLRFQVKTTASSAENSSYYTDAITIKGNTANVGIGTTSPGNLLHIQSASSGFSGSYDTRYKSILEANGEAYYATYVPDNSYSGIRFNNTSGLRGFIDYYHGTQGDALVYSAANHHRFLTNGVERVRLIQNGNVGIGTTSPTRKLHVVDSVWDNEDGGGVIFQNSNGVGASLTLKPTASLVTNGTNGWAMYAGGPSSAIGDGNLGFWAHGTNDAMMMITRGGNVGIGTTSPATKLHISGGTDTAVIRLENVSTGLSAGDTLGAVQFYNNDDTDNSPNIAASIYAVAGPSGGSGHLRFRTKETGVEGAAATDTMTLNNAGNVGIGTTSPTYKLDVDGTGRFKGNVNIYKTAPKLIVEATDAGQASIDVKNTSLSARWILDADDLFRVYNQTSAFDAFAIKSSGNVGIGTTSPSTPFHVTTASNSVATFETTSTADMAIELKNSQGSMFFGLGGGEEFAVGTDADLNGTNSKFVVKSSGNVGIGTTSPQTKLHVQSGAGIFNVSDDWHQSTHRTHLFRGGGFNSSISEESTAVKIFNGSSTTGKSVGAYWGGIGFMHLDPELGSWGTTYTGEHFWIGGRLIDTPGQERSALVFATNNVTTAGSHSSEKMVILPNGNVGIGTTSPAATLHISKGSNNSPTVLRIENVDTTIETAQEVNTIQFYTNDGSTSGTGITSKIVQVAENPGNQYGLSFYTYDLGLAEALRITNDGNVGIGTTSPASKLDVDGDIALKGTAVFNFVSPALTIGDIAGTDSVNSLKLTTADDSTTVYLDDGGNVGIGTTSPSTALTISKPIDSSSYGSGTKAIDFKVYYPGYDEDTIKASIYVGVSDKGTLNTQGGYLGFMTSNDGTLSERLRIEKNGNVGIGTTSPVSKLQVEGDIALAANGVIGQGSIYGNSGNSSFSTLKLYDSSTGDTVLNNQSYDIELNTAGGTKLIVKNNGNVGIGTTSPASKLDVNGDIAVKGTSVFNLNSAALTIGDIAGTDSVTNLTLTTAGGSTEVFLDDSGNVGINDTTPSYALDVTGTIRATGDVIAYSDARVKENVETIPNALDKVKSMRGVGYNKIGEEKRSIGVIAQEMLDVIPEVVHTDDQGMHSVAYGNLVGVLIEAMKEQQQQIDELKAQLNGIAK